MEARVPEGMRELYEIVVKWDDATGTYSVRRDGETILECAGMDELGETTALDLLMLNE